MKIHLNLTDCFVIQSLVWKIEQPCLEPRRGDISQVGELGGAGVSPIMTLLRSEEPLCLQHHQENVIALPLEGGRGCF